MREGEWLNKRIPGGRMMTSSLTDDRVWMISLFFFLLLTFFFYFFLLIIHKVWESTERICWSTGRRREKKTRNWGRKRWKRENSAWNWGTSGEHRKRKKAIRRTDLAGRNGEKTGGGMCDGKTKLRGGERKRYENDTFFTVSWCEVHFFLFSIFLSYFEALPLLLLHS